MVVRNTIVTRMNCGTINVKIYQLFVFNYDVPKLCLPSVTHIWSHLDYSQLLARVLTVISMIYNFDKRHKTQKEIKHSKNTQHLTLTRRANGLLPKGGQYKSRKKNNKQNLLDLVVRHILNLNKMCVLTVYRHFSGIYIKRCLKIPKR